MHRFDFKNYNVNPNDVVIRKATLIRDFHVHIHNFSELVLIIGGEGEHIVENSCYPLRSGDVYVINPDVSHGFRTSSRLEFYNIAFEPALALCDEVRSMKGYRVLFDIEPIYRIENNFSAKLTLEPSKLIEASGLAEEMMSMQESYSDDKNTIIPMLNNLLISRLSSWYDNQKELPSRQLLALSATIGYIQKNLSQHLNEEILASKAHYSLRHLRRMFKSVFQMTPKQYVTKQRMQLAGRLLNETTLNVSQIGAKCGYPDCSHFIHVFSSYCNMTPKNYRNATIK